MNELVKELVNELILLVKLDVLVDESKLEKLEVTCKDFKAIPSGQEAIPQDLEAARAGRDVCPQTSAKPIRHRPGRQTDADD